MPRYYDISLPIQDGGLVYPGNPPIQVAPQQAIARGASSNVSSLHFGSHSATHIDAPRHIFDHGGTVDHVPLDALIGRALVLEWREDVRVIDAPQLKASALAQYAPRTVERVLLKTRNSQLLHDGNTFHQDYTYLAPDGAAYLVELGVRLVGIDYLSIEQFHSGHHRTHRTLLEHNVVILEGVQLDAVPAGFYHLICLPLKIASGDGAPARAILATLHDEEE